MVLVTDYFPDFKKVVKHWVKVVYLNIKLARHGLNNDEQITLGFFLKVTLQFRASVRL